MYSKNAYSQALKNKGKEFEITVGFHDQTG
jgi:hypothetical protein